MPVLKAGQIWRRVQFSGQVRQTVAYPMSLLRGWGRSAHSHRRGARLQQLEAVVAGGRYSHTATAPSDTFHPTRIAQPPAGGRVVPVDDRAWQGLAHGPYPPWFATCRRLLRHRDHQGRGHTGRKPASRGRRLWISGLVHPVARFDDFANLEDHEIQQLISRIGRDRLAVALKASSDRLLERFRANMSAAAWQALVDTMEKLGRLPMSVMEVERAQMLAQYCSNDPLV